MATREPVQVTPARLRDWSLPEPDGAKRSRGQVLVIGGSPSTPGAVELAGLAALRVGAGVLALAVAASCAPALAVAVPEASVTGLRLLDGDAEDLAELDPVGPSCDTILAGPGIDRPEPASRVLEMAAATSASLVLDAFVLGVLRGSPVADRIAARSVLTPNAAEAARLLDREEDDLGDEVALTIAESYGAVVSFQGDIAAPDGRIWTVSAGHPGVGTSGSGDVLAGAVAGLMARGADPVQAACWATYLHASAGDRLAARVGRLGFLARELVDELPAVIVQTEA